MNPASSVRMVWPLNSWFTSLTAIARDSRSPLAKRLKKDMRRLSSRSHTAGWVTASVPMPTRIVTMDCARPNSAMPTVAASRPRPISISRRSFASGIAVSMITAVACGVIMPSSVVASASTMMNARSPPRPRIEKRTRSHGLRASSGRRR